MDHSEQNPPVTQENVSPVMDADELEASLKSHALRTADRARAKLGGPLNESNLSQFLQDEDCLRYPTELRFDDLNLESHQFAEPAFEVVNEERRCVLHIRAKYERQPRTHPYIVAYHAAAINYAQAASSSLCEIYGAALLDMSVDDFYAAVCQVADQ